jgi:lipoprotein-anchoring transpeptidase ErfK/SrfK
MQLGRRTTALGVALASTVLLAGCAGLEVHGGSGTPGASDAAAAASSPAPAAPKLTVESPASWKTPLTVGVANGTLTDVVVTDTSSQDPLAGDLSSDGLTWTSAGLPASGASYRVKAMVTTAAGSAQLTTSAKVSTQPDSAKLKYGINPGAGATVGVNAPVVIRFNHPVNRKEDVENNLHVYSSSPVTGAWHWISSSEVHFRPETTWPTHTQVRVVADLKGVQLSDTRYGVKDGTANFTVGDSHVTVVDDKSKTVTVTVNGKKKYTWPTSLGRPEFVTRSGNYIVLEKLPIREMTSCTAKITCDKTSKDYYDLQVQWATRLSWSGTFIHAAPWSAAKQGLVDSSHGCIHLTIDRAKTYFDLAQYGDLVTVKNTGRPIDDLVSHGDPGASDWNTSWSSWVAGSALGSPVTSEPIPT